jgi:hypothetical protein
MYYETKSFQELVEIMASCERLGLLYVVQKDVVAVKRGLGFMARMKSETIYKLQVVQYVEEESPNEDIQGRQSESEETDGETES